MRKSPAVSIIVPVYKVEPWLKRCLDSLIGQTLREIEIICIDDGSPDNCGKMIDEYAERDKRIKVFHQKNQGAAVARNVGLVAAKGEYIGFVDPDDWADCGFFEGLYKVARKTGSDIVKGSVVRKDFNGTHSGPSFDGIRENRANFSYSFWSAIYKRTFLKKNDISFPAGVITGQDLVFLVKAVCLANRIELVDNDVFYKYEKREGSLDSESLSDDKIRSKIAVLRLNLDFMNSMGKRLDREVYSRVFALEMSFLLNVVAFRTKSHEMRQLIIESARKLYADNKYKDDFKKTNKALAVFLEKRGGERQLKLVRVRTRYISAIRRRVVGVVYRGLVFLGKVKRKILRRNS